MAVADQYPLKILLLDPAPHSAKMLEQLLARMRSCEVISAPTLREGLQHISNTPPDLIITHWRLKDHTAEELLKAMNSRADWRAIPVLVCSDSRSRQLKQKVRALGAYDYLITPLSGQLLRGYLDILFPLSSPLAQVAGSASEGATSPGPAVLNDIKLQLSRIQTLAPLPILAQAILEIGNDPHTSAADLKSVIEKDQPLTAKILKTVNSAYYGFHRKIGNIDRAIVILGFNEIVNITLAACIIEAYHDVGDSPHFSRRGFWIHALGAAYIARALTTIRPGVNSKDAFVIGLLHDFGKVVLDQHFHKEFQRILAEAAYQKRPLHHVTTEYLGIDHAEIGGIVAESWKLPPSLVMAIRYHHAPEICTGHYYEVALAHLANYYSHKYEIGESGNPVPDAPHEAALNTLGLTPGDLDEAWRMLRIDLEALRTIL